MTETETRLNVEVDQNYPGFCCQGFDYLIRLIFPDENIGRTEIWGSCQNPNCPNYSEQSGPSDPYRGVNSCDLDDFEATLEEKGVKRELNYVVQA